MAHGFSARSAYSPLRLALMIALAAVATWACEGDLSPSVEGKGCGPAGECLPGYTCDDATNVCVVTGSVMTPVVCRDGETTCGGECVVLAEREDHCGGCGATCTAPANAEAVCVSGVCRFTCQDGFTPCGDACLDTSGDVDNCGGCGDQCRMPENGAPTCVDGVCGVTCDTPFTDCSGVCIDLDVDPQHCGDCSHGC